MNVILKKISRRTFLKATGCATAAPILWQVSGCGAKSETAEIDLKSFISIHDTFIEFVLPRTEMGQDLITSFSLILAEELDCALQNLRVRFSKADTALSPQKTVGSASIRLWHKRLASIGAHLRAHMIEAAAQAHQTSPDNIEIRNSIISVRGTETNIEKSLNYFEFMQKAPLEQAIISTPKAREHYQLVGTSQTSLSAHAKVTGKFDYINDFKPTDSSNGHLNEPLSLVMTVAYKQDWPLPKADELITLKEKHKLSHIFLLEKPISGFKYRIVLISNKQWNLFKAQKHLLEQLNVHLKSQTQARSKFEKALSNSKEELAGSGLTITKGKIDAIFYTPELCHQALETPSVIAYFKENKLKVWAPTQAPQSTRKRVAEKLKLAQQDVELQTVPMGGSFGRKRYSDFVEEASFISHHLNQANLPSAIKLLWSREDDIYRENYRPASIQTFSWNKATPDKFKHKLIESTAVGTPHSKNEKRLIPFCTLTPTTSVESIEGHHKTGIWRAVHHGYTAFAFNSFIHEVSTNLGEDPTEYLSKNLESPSLKDRVMTSLKPGYHYNPERHMQTISRVKKMANWDNNDSSKRVLGFSSFQLFHSYASMIVAIKPDSNTIIIDKIWIAVDCGMIINPDGLDAQLTGGICFALSACLFGEAPSSTNLAANFDVHPVMRIEHMPKIETYYETNTHPASGCGELAVPLVAPALANAYRELSGKRFMSMPFLSGNEINIPNLETIDQPI